MAPISAQAVVIVVAVPPFVFRLYPLGALAALVLLAGFGGGVGALSYALAVASGKQEWIFYTVQQTLLFPLLILSGTMLPLESGPSWMQLLFRIYPLTHVVEAERALFAGDLSHPSGPIAALAWRWSALQWGRAPCAARPIDRLGPSCTVKPPKIGE